MPARLARRSVPSALEEELARTQAKLEAERVAHCSTRARLEALTRACDRFVSPRLLALLGARSLEEIELGNQVERPVTILSSSIRDFGAISRSMRPGEAFEFINAHLAAMEPAILRHGGIIDRYIGATITALFPSDADQALRAALAMHEALAEHNVARAVDGEPPLGIGIVLDTGIVSLGAVGGPTRMENTVVGDAVDLGARLESLAKTYGAPLLIGERTLHSLADSTRYATRFVDRIRVEGRVQPESIYEVFEGDAPALRAEKLAMRRRFEEAVAYHHLKQSQRAVPLLEVCVASVPEDGPARAYLARCREHLTTGRHEGAGELDGPLAWRDDFLVGFAGIDAQHRQLFSRMNHLVEEVRRGEARGASGALGFLSDYADHHFATEEALMMRHAYPLTAEHLREHETFGRHFRELRRELEEGRRDPLFLAFRVQVSLVDWFVSHTTRTDRHLGRYLGDRGVSDA